MCIRDSVKIVPQLPGCDRLRPVRREVGKPPPALLDGHTPVSYTHLVLIPMNLCDTYVAGVSQKSSAIMDDAMEHIRQLLTEMGDTACL